MSNDPYELVKHDGKTVDRITHEALKVAERRLGYELTITQGSYSKSVEQSAGTHDGGGVVDLAPFEADRKVRELRKIGFAAWRRLPSEGDWPEHVHAVLIGNKKLSPAALHQVTAYRNGRNGLKSNLPDRHWRPNPIPTFRWPITVTRATQARQLLNDAREVLAEAVKQNTGPRRAAFLGAHAAVRAALGCLPKK
jgi:hypothetical protein